MSDSVPKTKFSRHLPYVKCLNVVRAVTVTPITPAVRNFRINLVGLNMGTSNVGTQLIGDTARYTPAHQALRCPAHLSVGLCASIQASLVYGLVVRAGDVVQPSSKHVT